MGWTAPAEQPERSGTGHNSGSMPKCGAVPEGGAHIRGMLVAEHGDKLAG
jgi:hypothetical protein